MLQKRFTDVLKLIIVSIYLSEHAFLSRPQEQCHMLEIPYTVAQPPVLDFMRAQTLLGVCIVKEVLDLSPSESILGAVKLQVRLVQIFQLSSLMIRNVVLHKTH